MADSQVTTGILKALHDQQAAAQYAKNPAAYWQSIGGSLPPGVSAAQFAGRVAANPLHQAIVGRSTGHGQMSVLDDSDCSKCIAFAQFCIDLAGIPVSAGASLIPGVDAWLAGLVASGNVMVVGTILQAGVAGAALALCQHNGKC